MNKETVLSSINNHIEKFGKIHSYKSFKHKEELDWLNDHFKDIDMYDKTDHIEKIYLIYRTKCTVFI